MRTVLIRTILVGAVVCAALCSASPAHAARKKVVVMPFDGPQGETAEEAVTLAIKRKHQVIDSEAFQKKRKEVGARGRSDDDYAKVAEALGADALVGGQIKRRGGKWELDIEVRDGASGGVVEQVTIPLKGPRLDDEATSSLSPMVMPALLKADGRSGGVKTASDEGDEDEADAPRRKKRKSKSKADDEEADESSDEGGDDEVAEDDEGDEERVSKKSKKKKKKHRDEDEDEDEDEEDEDEGDYGDSDAWLALRTLEIGAGLGFVGRSFAYDDSDLQAYSSGLAPGLVLFAQSFPFHDKEGFLGKLGLGFNLGMEPFTKAKLKVSPDETTELGIKQFRVSFDVRYGMRLGETFSVMPNIGVGQTYFAIVDKDVRVPSECRKVMSDKVICLSDVIVLHAKIGADARLALSREIALFASLAVLPGISVAATEGQIAEEAADRALGLGGGLSLGYRLSDSLALRGGFEFTRFGHTLDTADAPCPTVCYTSAIDTYYGLNVAAMYMTK